MSIVSVSSSSTCLRSTIQSQRHGPKLNLSHLLQRAQSLPFSRTVPKTRTTHITTSRDMKIYSGRGFGSPSPPPSQKPWIFKVAGALLSAILSFLKKNNNLGSFLKLTKNMDTVVHVAEDVAQKVEKVAEGVEKVAEGIADHLPKGGILNKAATFVESTAETIVKEADAAVGIMDKVEKLEDGLNLFLKLGGGSKEKDAKKKK